MALNGKTYKVNRLTPVGKNDGQCPTFIDAFWCAFTF